MATRMIILAAAVLAALVTEPSAASRSLLTLRAEAFGRRLMGANPDHPAQRGATPAWMSGGSSGGSQQASSNTKSYSQPSNSGNNGNAKSGSSSGYIYSGGQFGSGWSDSTYGARPFTDFTPQGKSSGAAKCYYLSKGGATSFHGPAGAFSGHKAVEFWAYSAGTQVPDVDVLIGSSSRECRHVPLSSLSVAANSNGWVKYYVPLSSFSFDHPASGSAFLGCGASGPGAGEVVKVDLRNTHPEYVALLCVDEVRLV